MKRKVDVTLLGHRFTVKTDRDEAFVKGLAAHVGKKIEEVRRNARSSGPEAVALFAALQIAEELFEERERAAGSRADVRRTTEAMVEKLTAALRDGSLDHLVESRRVDTRSLDARAGDDEDGEELALVAAPLSRQA